jgi:hypothetical protein
MVLRNDKQRGPIVAALRETTSQARYDAYIAASIRARNVCRDTKGDAEAVAAALRAMAEEEAQCPTLSDKQRRFIQEYLVDLNATQAAIRAGYSPKRAKVTAHRMLSNANFQAALSEAKLAVQERRAAAAAARNSGAATSRWMTSRSSPRRPPPAGRRQAPWQPQTHQLPPRWQIFSGFLPPSTVRTHKKDSVSGGFVIHGL